jgi:hypothetical protein
MSDLKKVDEDKIALGFSYQNTIREGKFGPQKSVVFQSHIPIDSDLATINALLDKLRIAGDRQILVYELDTVKDLLRDRLEKIAECEEQMVLQAQNWKATWDAKVEEGKRKGEWNEEEHLPAAERKAKINTLQSLTQWRADVIRYSKDIERLEILVNGHATEFSSNSDVGSSSG